MQLNPASDSSSSSDSGSDDSDLDNKPNDHQIQTNSNNKNVNVPSSKQTPLNINNDNDNNGNNRKRKLSNINSPNNKPTDLSISGPPKKRQRTNNITINTHIDNEDKKQRKKRKCVVKNKNKKKKRKKAETPPKKPVCGVKIEELECIVCRDLPQLKIYQCVNSHLLCDKCYARICEGKDCLCPECRVPMSRRQPSRNKLAENYLKAHLFDCLNAERGCKDKIQFCYLNEHSFHECKYRQIECKFSILGCEWGGLAKDRSKHNKICPIKSTEPKKILKLVSHLKVQNQEKQKKKDEQINKYAKIAKLFEMRARNIVCKDIRIAPWNVNSKKTVEIMNSNIFVVMRKRWQFQLKVEKVGNPKKNKNNSNNSTEVTGEKLNKLYIRLQCLSTARRRVPYQVCVIRGPDFGWKLEPIQFECEMTKNCRDSKWIEMIPDNILFNDEDLQTKFFTNYNRDSKMNLRIVMIDKRASGVSTEFGGDNDNFDGFPPLGEGGLSDNSNGNDSISSSLSSTSSDSSSLSRRSRSRSLSRSRNVSDNMEDTDDDDMYSDLDDDDYSSSQDFY